MNVESGRPHNDVPPSEDRYQPYESEIDDFEEEGSTNKANKVNNNSANSISAVNPTLVAVSPYSFGAIEHGGYAEARGSYFRYKTGFDSPACSSALLWLHVFEWVTTLIAFATMSSQSSYASLGGAAFRFLVAGNVMAWLYAMFAVGQALMEARSRRLQQEETIQSMVNAQLLRVCGDVISFIFTLAGGCAAAAKCAESSSDPNTSTVCSSEREPIAAVFFSLLSSVLFAVSAISSIRAWRATASWINAQGGQSLL